MISSVRLLGLLLLMATLPVSAGDWQMAKGSSLGFSSSFQGEVFNGIKTNPHLENVESRDFGVFEDLSSITTAKLRVDA